MGRSDSAYFEGIPKQIIEFTKGCLNNPIFLQNMEFLSKNSIHENNVQNALQILKLVEDKYRYELTDEKFPKAWKPKILDAPTTIDNLLTSRKSLCRFGDGECTIMKGQSIGFQEYDAELAERLRQILADEQTDCYVGINRYYWYILDEPERSTNPVHYRFYTFNVPQYREFYKAHCNKEKIYATSNLGGYMSQKSLEFCEERYNQLKTLFKDKKLVIVAGETVFDNIKYDLFEYASKKEFVFAPRVNAFKKFHEILEKLSTYPKDCVMVLILGPTATVLAYELSKCGYVSYDIGHLPKDYDAFMKRADRSAEAISKFYAPD